MDSGMPAITALDDGPFTGCRTLKVASVEASKKYNPPTAISL